MVYTPPIHNTGYPDIDHLLCSIDQLDLAFGKLPHPSDLPTGFEAVRVTSRLGIFDCLVDDEYRDTDGAQAGVVLQVLLLTVLDYNESPNDTEWFEKNRFGDIGAMTKRLLGDLKQFWAVYRVEINTPTRIVDPLSWQLNSGAAYFLRNLGAAEMEETPPAGS